MGIMNHLAGFTLRELVGGVCHVLGISLAAEGAAKVTDFLQHRFSDRSLELLDALKAANERAWRSLEVALAGESFWSFLADRAATTRILDELVAAGRLGQKSGAGFYSYAKSSRGADDPAFAALLDKVRRDRRTISPEEITDRLFLPMLTEASRCLSEGIVRDPGDVDMGLILGIGFPTFRGGLLRWADTEGLDKILSRLTKYEALGKRFEPTELLRQRAAAEKGFYG